MYFLIILLGLTIGSFLNVCIYRIPRGKSVSFPPSHCPHCKNRLRFYDLVPVLSYIVLGGRCRYCTAKISPQYPIVEALTALIFLFIFKRYGFSAISIKYMILACVCIVVSFIDYFTMDIYYITLLPGLIAGGLYLFIDKSKILSSVSGLILGYGVIKIIDKVGQRFFHKKSMGDGDAAFLAVLGFMLGLRLTVVAIFMAFIIGGAFAAYILLFKDKARDSYIPFGPFLGIGGYISAVFGNEIIKFYLSLFNIY